MRRDFRLKIVVALFKSSYLKILSRIVSKKEDIINLRLSEGHSCDKNIEIIVTWGKNTNLHYVQFVCVSMGRLFSGVLP